MKGEMAIYVYVAVVDSSVSDVVSYGVTIIY